MGNRLMKLYKKIAVLLIMTIFTCSFPDSLYAKEVTNNASEIVYVDGIPFQVETLDGNGLYVTSNYKNESIKFVYYNRSNSTLQITSNNQVEKYELKFNSLSEENFNVDIYQNSKLIDNINQDMDSYEGQAISIPLSALGYYLLSLAVSVVIVEKAVDVIDQLKSGATVTDGFYEYVEANVMAIAIAKDLKKRDKFYPAIISDVDECTIGISPKSIDRATAINWVRAGGCIYTYDKYTAKTLLDSCGLGAIEHDYHDNNGLKKGVWFKHFHPAQANYHYAHVFFGVPRVNY